MTEPQRRIPALVVSGFLGSGKTTLVREQLRLAQQSGIRIAVVTNEFGELGIDRALLGSGSEAFVELEGGCVCCKLGDELVETLQELRETVNPDRIIVETSGLAQPYDTLINFWRKPVSDWVRDEASIVVVNAEQVAEGRELDGVFEDQICDADMIIINKLDLLPRATTPDDGSGSEDLANGDNSQDEPNSRAVEQVVAAIREREPDAPVITATRGRVAEALLFPPDASELPGNAPARRKRAGKHGADCHDHGHHHQTSDGSQHDHGTGTDQDSGSDHASPRPAHRHGHEDYTTEIVDITDGIACSELLERIEGWAAARAKGFIRTAEGLKLIQAVGRRVEATDPPEPPAEDSVGRLVVIRRQNFRSSPE